MTNPKSIVPTNRTLTVTTLAVFHFKNSATIAYTAKAPNRGGFNANGIGIDPKKANKIPPLIQSVTFFVIKK